MRTRAERRHNDRRKYNKALRMIRVWEGDSEHLLWRVRRIYNNMANCSCDMCGNERNNGWESNRMKLTMQERRAEDSFEAGYNQWHDYDRYDAMYGDNYYYDDNDNDWWDGWYYGDNSLEDELVKFKYLKNYNKYTEAEIMWLMLKEIRHG